MNRLKPVRLSFDTSLKSDGDSQKEPGKRKRDTDNILALSSAIANSGKPCDDELQFYKSNKEKCDAEKLMFAAQERLLTAQSLSQEFLNKQAQLDRLVAFINNPANMGNPLVSAAEAKKKTLESEMLGL